MKSLTPIEQREIDFSSICKLVAALVEDGTIFVPLKQFCNEIGVSWEAQRRRINNHHTFGSKVETVKIAGPDGERGQLCLPVKYISGWLLGINPNSLKQRGAVEILVLFQEEAHERLESLFWEHAGIAKEKLFSSSLAVVNDRVDIAGKRIKSMFELFLVLDSRLERIEENIGSMATDIADLKRELESLKNG